MSVKYAPITPEDKSQLWEAFEPLAEIGAILPCMVMALLLENQRLLRGEFTEDEVKGFKKPVGTP